MRTHKMSEVINQENIKIPLVFKAVQNKKNQFYNNANNFVITSGKDAKLTELIVNMINSAEHTVVICSFLMADINVEDAIYNAANRDVRVYLMIACETRLDKDIPDDDFGKKCLDQHLLMLKRLGKIVLIRSAPFFHAKFILIDTIGPETTGCKGLLLTANLTKEALCRNEELAVKLTKSECKELAEISKWAFFELAEHQMLDKSDFRSVKKLDEISHPIDLNEIVFTGPNNQSILDQAMKLIEETNKKLIVSSFGWDENHKITEVICDKAKRGTEVIIFSRIRRSSKEALLKLKNAGAKVYGFEWLHAKAILSDSSRGMVMSANLQKHGLEEGFEVGVKLSEDRVAELSKCFACFLEKEPFELEVNINLGELIGNVQVIESNGKVSKFSISPNELIRLDDIKAECASNLELKQNIPKKSINETFSVSKDCPAHEIKYEWSVVAPILPEKSKEILWEETIVPDLNQSNPKKKKQKPKKVKHSYNPKVYQSVNSKKMIVINEEIQMNDALKLRDEKFPDAVIVYKENGK